MIKYLLPVAALAIAAPAFATQQTSLSSSTPVAFVRDGISYVGIVQTRGEAQLISGHDDAGHTFDLVVRNGHVSGTYGATPVSYDVPATSGYTLAQK